MGLRRKLRDIRDELDEIGQRTGGVARDLENAGDAAGDLADELGDAGGAIEGREFIGKAAVSGPQNVGGPLAPGREFITTGGSAGGVTVGTRRVRPTTGHLGDGFGEANVSREERRLGQPLSEREAAAGRRSEREGGVTRDAGLVSLADRMQAAADALSRSTQVQIEATAVDVRGGAGSRGATNDLLRTMVDLQQQTVDILRDRPAPLGSSLRALGGL